MTKYYLDAKNSERDLGMDFSDALSDFSSTSEEEVSAPASQERDEVREVQKLASKDTSRINLWRYVVTLVLLATAAAVTLTTYLFLKEEENSNFVEAFQQFSRTVADAEIEQRRNIREACESLSDIITSSAIAANATWPYYTLPDFERYAYHYRVQSKTELTTVSNIVTLEQSEDWIAYANETYEDWVEEGHMLNAGNLDRLNPVAYQPIITRLTAEGLIPELPRPDYLVYWSFSPPPANYALVNGNVRSVPDYDELYLAMLALRNQTVVSQVRPYATAVGIAFTQEQHDAMHSDLPLGETEHPHSFFMHPVYEELQDTTSNIVAVLTIGSAWDATLQDLLPEGVNGIDAVISNNCNQSFTYRINGPLAQYRGTGDLHERGYDDMSVNVALSTNSHPNFTSTDGHCIYEMNVYPSDEFKATYDSNTPEIFAIIVASTFVMVALVFIVYDILVYQRNNKIMSNAARSNAIVSKLFPDTIRDKLIGQGRENNPLQGTAKGLDGFFTDGKTTDDSSQPLADLFLETTVIFADIAGFTAWSSVREPHQVFNLLENVYSEFDKIAKRRQIFKVETVGDCYVGVAGVPRPQADHAIIMVRFARDIMLNMQKVVKGLEVILGPDTGDLNLRIGIHSGPVTAGVLRGERARFQLFGDTMNTAARIESTCIVGKIQMSKETAALLKAAGKEHWIAKREDLVVAKGKGQIETYWLKGIASQTNESTVASTAGSRSDDEGMIVSSLNEKTNRLIEWNCEVLLQLLRQIVACRSSGQTAPGASPNAVGQQQPKRFLEGKEIDASTMGSNFLEEVVEIIHLPEFDHSSGNARKNLEDVVLPTKVINQMNEYIRCVAKMYRKNKFHNFEHASHVLMSVTKLMSRIVAPSDIDIHNAGTLHDHTYGITSDPLTQFSCALAAILHDVDHSGVPNAQLLKENASFSSFYKNRSMAEQNSLDLAWRLLMEEKFKDLRAAIYSNDEELKRFRELLVNSVMATDIADKELKVLRNDRWDKAFKESSSLTDTAPEDLIRDSINRKATIVIEHLIQASDVAHTMQHWHVYRKWNESLFQECYQAYLDGRADKDPSIGWYKGEIGFFDFYIIPLAKKLKDCGVFGKSSDEYLNYAMQNRNEWEARGEAMTAEMLEHAKRRIATISEESAMISSEELSMSSS